MAIAHKIVGKQRAPWVPYALSVVGITIAVAALASASFWFEKQRARERAAVATQNVVNLLESQIRSGFEKVDIALQSVAFSYQKATHEGALRIDELNTSLERNRPAKSSCLVRVG